MCVHTKEVLKNSLYKHILKYKKKKNCHLLFIIPRNLDMILWKEQNFNKFLTYKAWLLAKSVERMLPYSYALKSPRKLYVLRNDKKEKKNTNFIFNKPPLPLKYTISQNESDLPWPTKSLSSLEIFGEWRTLVIYMRNYLFYSEVVAWII